VRIRTISIRAAIVAAVIGVGLVAPISPAHAEPSFDIDPDSHDFGQVAIGSTATQVFDISLSSDTAYIDLIPTLNPEAGFHYDDSNCIGVVEDTCTVTATFTPIAEFILLDQVDITVCDIAPTGICVLSTVNIRGEGVKQDADLSVALAAPAKAQSKVKPVTFQAIVSNTGTDAATNAELDIRLPQDSLFLAVAAPDGTTCTTPPVNSNGNISCTIERIEAGGSATVTVTIQATGKKKTWVAYADVTPSEATEDTEPSNNYTTFGIPIR